MMYIVGIAVTTVVHETLVSTIVQAGALRAVAASSEAARLYAGEVLEPRYQTEITSQFVIHKEMKMKHEREREGCCNNHHREA